MSTDVRRIPLLDIRGAVVLRVRLPDTATASPNPKDPR